jgi:hypothetical protein
MIPQKRNRTRSPLNGSGRSERTGCCLSADYAALQVLILAFTAWAYWLSLGGAMADTIADAVVIGLIHTAERVYEPLWRHKRSKRGSKWSRFM